MAVIAGWVSPSRDALTAENFGAVVCFETSARRASIFLAKTSRSRLSIDQEDFRAILDHRSSTRSRTAPVALTFCRFDRPPMRGGSPAPRPSCAPSFW